MPWNNYLKKTQIYCIKKNKTKKTEKTKCVKKNKNLENKQMYLKTNTKLET